MSDFDGYRYDQWKTSEPDYTSEQEQQEPDWDSINDAAREDAAREDAER